MSPLRSKLFVYVPLVMVSLINIFFIVYSVAQGRYILPFGLYGALGFGLWVWYYLRSFDFWEKAVLFFISGCIVALKGFVYLGIELGEYLIPIGEITIIIALVRTFKSDNLSLFLQEKTSQWMILWLVFGLVRMSFAINEIEYHTLKSTCMIYYVLFTYFAYLIAQRQETQHRVMQLLGISILLLLVHLIFYSPAMVNLSLSPRVGQDLTLFGYFGSPYFNTTAGAFFFILLGSYYFSWSPWLHHLFAIALFSMTFLQQARSGLLALLVCVFVASLFGRLHHVMKLLSGALVMIVLFVLIFSTGIHLRGTKGAFTWASFLVQIQSIVSGSQDSFFLSEVGSDDIMLKNQMGTREGRIKIWQGIISKTMSSPRSIFLGQGFRRPLLRIELDQDRAPKRSPHNGFVLIFGYLGLVGLFLFVMFNVTFSIRIIKTLLTAQLRENDKICSVLLWLYLYYIALFTGAMFTPVFGTPYLMSVFCFIIGLGLAMCRQIELDSPGMRD
ncbi:O-antigen ligase family protein [candidate division CSSED10-310 bacterium]|uniref:O-antigen ligase family protein n=1 Tax=candidate division CSSED10-310 bacterium TaxID=2855610 RepID=A0ABV6YWM9_UNCC1